MLCLSDFETILCDCRYFHLFYGSLSDYSFVRSTSNTLVFEHYNGFELIFLLGERVFCTQLKLGQRYSDLFVWVLDDTTSQWNVKCFDGLSFSVVPYAVSDFLKKVV